MKMNKNVIGIGILLAALASACAPKVRTAPAATEDKKEEAKATDDKSAGKVQILEGEDASLAAADELNRKMIIQAGAIRKSIEADQKVVCVRPNLSQVRLGEKSGTAQAFELDITCLKAAGEDGSGNNQVLRVSVGGTMDSESKEVKFEEAKDYSISEGVLELAEKKAE